MKLGEKGNPKDLDWKSYFKIGISREYILIRDDFPMTEIAPGDFTKLIIEMFKRNDEALETVGAAPTYGANNEK